VFSHFEARDCGAGRQKERACGSGRRAVGR